MVNKLYSELVPLRRAGHPEEMEAFWAEHADEYFQPEPRLGTWCSRRNEDKALEAMAAMDDGDAPGSEILARVRDRPGEQGPCGTPGRRAAAEENEPVSATLFALERGRRQ